jgi:carboxyl-terminal processing protease
MKALFLALVLTFVTLGTYAQAPPTAPSAVADAESAGLRLAAFDKVWNTVNDNHYDPTFGGVDWKKVRGDYLPKATAAKSDAEFNGVLRQMLSELRLSHFGIFAKDVAKQIAGNAGVGIELKMIDDLPVVWKVAAGSTAESGGVARGMRVTTIDGKSVPELLKPLEASFSGRTLTPQMRSLYRQRTLEAFISGAAESTVKLELTDAKDQSRAFELVRKPFAGEMSKPMGFFPAQPVDFESKRLDGNIGYIRFNMWVIPQMAKIRSAVRELADAKGMIFDLRGNPGGVGGMAAGVGGLVMDRQASLGRMRMRAGSIDFVVYPQEKPFLGPVVILTDYGSASTSEVFAAGMQELGRAKVIGGTTAGAVLPSVFVTLPTGAIFQYVVSDYRSPKEILVEGRGVTPDLAVAADRQALLEGRDAQLEAAVRSISSR